MKTDLKAMQLSIEALIKATAALSDIPVISEERQDLVNQIETSLAKLGLCIVIQTVDAKVSHPNLPGPVFDAMTVSVLVHENVLINRSKSDRTALAVAQDVALALHLKTIPGAGGPLLCQSIQFQSDSRVLSYAVDFKIGQ